MIFNFEDFVARLFSVFRKMSGSTFLPPTFILYAKYILRFEKFLLLLFLPTRIVMHLLFLGL